MRWLFSALLGASACGRFGFDASGPLGDAGTDGTGPGDAATIRHNRAFITGATHTIPWGGVSGADGACQAAADTAQLGGTFIAFMGDDTNRPLPRLAAARGWVDLAGSAIADQPAEWFDGTMRRALHREESGSLVPYGIVFIGAMAGSTCSDWTTTAGTGSIAYTTNYFDEFNIAPCTSTGRFACLETAYTAPLVEAPQVGRYAFVTSTMWLPGAGLLDADAFCAARASAVGLPGSYKALLATVAATAVSRFSLTGATWVNVNGEPVFATPGELATGTYLTAFLRTEAGAPATNAPAWWAWTGDAVDNCNDYTSLNAGQSAMTGDASSAQRSYLFARQTYPCNIARPLICLQE